MADLTNIYDLFFPSPPPLEELASMEVALILWRREIQLHLAENGTLRERYSGSKTSLRCLTSVLPSAILPIIERYVVKLKSSIPDWLKYHCKARIFEVDVLNHFLDFVCDFDGRIHYGNTAKRLLTCHGISNDVKFKMACFYCLEDDIIRIWPMVSDFIKLNEIQFHEQPKLYYWVCRLRNKLHKIELDEHTPDIETRMLTKLCLNEDFGVQELWSIEHFLNPMCVDNKMIWMARLASWFEDLPIYIGSRREFFARYFLAKLDEERLYQVVVFEEGKDLVIHLQPEYVSQVFSYIQNEMTNDGFHRLVEAILFNQTENSSTKDCTSYFCEVWTISADRLKQTAIPYVMHDISSWCFERICSISEDDVEDRRSVSFLSAILMDAPIKDRRTFWNKHWDTLMYAIKPDDFRILMNLCFNNDENQKNEFKRNFLVRDYDETIHPQLEELLGYGFFTELEEFLAFWCLNEQTKKQIRFKLLHGDFIISKDLVYKTSLLNKFIDDAFENNDLATDFKNKLLVAPKLSAIVSLKWCLFFNFRIIMEFVDTFAPTEEIAIRIKKDYILPALKSILINPYRFQNYLKKEFDKLKHFISWRITQFKETVNMDSIVQRQRQAQAKKTRVDRPLENRVDYDWFENSFSNLEDA